MSKKKRPWVTGDWHYRKLRDEPNAPGFIEMKAPKGIPYGLDVCGEDYGHYGGEPKREATMQMLLLAPRMAEYFLKQTADIYETTEFVLIRKALKSIKLRKEEVDE